MSEMTPELRARLLDRLAVRSDRLAKMAALNAPTSVIAMMAENVATTSMLLLGDTFTHAVVNKLLGLLRESNGICICGNGVMPPDQPLCTPCLEQVNKDDREAEQYLAMHRVTKGQPS